MTNVHPVACALVMGMDSVVPSDAFASGVKGIGDAIGIDLRRDRRGVCIAVTAFTGGLRDFLRSGRDDTTWL
jgi:hypothetical protein